MSKFVITLDGMEEVRKNLRRIDDKLGKALGQVHKRLGSLIVGLSEMERSKMATRYGSYNMNRLKVKPSANQRRLLITIRPFAAESGIEAHPVFGNWMRASRMEQRVWPSKKSGGYLIEPVVRDNAKQITEEYLEAVSKLARDAIGE